MKPRITSRTLQDAINTRDLIQNEMSRNERFFLSESPEELNRITICCRNEDKTIILLALPKNKRENYSTYTKYNLYYADIYLFVSQHFLNYIKTKFNTIYELPYGRWYCNPNIYKDYSYSASELLDSLPKSVRDYNISLLLQSL